MENLDTVSNHTISDLVEDILVDGQLGAPLFILGNIRVITIRIKRIRRIIYRSEWIRRVFFKFYAKPQTYKEVNIEELEVNQKLINFVTFS